MSARRADDVSRLREAIVAHFQQNVIETELFLPWSAQQHRGDIFASCEVLSERADGDGAYLSVRAEPGVIERMRDKLAVR